MDQVAVLCSIGLQYGVPWPKIAEKMRHTNFGNEAQDPNASSLVDALAQAVDHIIEDRRQQIGAGEEPE